MKRMNMTGSRLASRLSSVAGYLLLALILLPGSSALWSQTTFPGQIGMDVADRPTGFVDAFKDQGRFFTDASGNVVPTDASGNPLTDGAVAVFDDRAFSAWAPPTDDPAAYQPDCTGTYLVSFQGQAILSNVASYPTLTFANQTYNPATNTTTVNVTLPPGPSIMVISFTNTQRTPSSGTDTGISGLQAIRPGFTASQIFDPAFVNAFAPFSFLRFVDWTATNTKAGYYGVTGHNLISWDARSLPTDFFQGVGDNIANNPNARAGAWGISWEYVILLANATHKDIWINVPISATGGSDPLDPTYVASPDTSSYIYNLAYLLKNGDAFTGNVGLDPGLHIYIEHSNEVFNYGFTQYTWNLLAAEDEVSQGGSVLNNDGNTNTADWAARRHIKRLYEIAQIFQSVFGAGSLNTTIRPIYAWWQIDEGPNSGAANALAWFKNTYGPPSNYFYAMAQADYFYATNYANDTTIPEVLSDMQADSDARVPFVQQGVALAAQYGLPLYAYEGGPDNSNGGSGTTTNIGVQILANRDPGMDTLLQYHVRNNWFAQGGAGYSYYSLSTAYSRSGSWGATDDYRNLSTVKYNALLNLTGYTQSGVPVAPGALVATAGNQAVALTWEAVPGAANYNVERGLASGGPYTTVATISSTTYSDTTVTNGTTYYYVVTGVNSSGESAPSNEASATPQAMVPSAPYLSAAAGSGQATLNWTAPVGATSYNVYQGTTAGGENATPIATGITTTSYTAPDLTNGSTYYFVVAAVNSVGTGATSNEASVVPNSPPGAPTNLIATAGPGAATLSWTAASGANSYNVYQGTAAGGESTTPIATGITATTDTVTGLTNGTAYYFTVVAINLTGPSAPSNEATATPAPPSGLLAYEPFGEAAGAVLSGASGGGDFGWGAPWVVQANSTNVPGYNVVSTNPLTYPGLVANGNYAIGGDKSYGAGRALNLTASGPFSGYLSKGMIGAPGQTIWLSFLMRKDVKDALGIRVTLTPSTGAESWYPGSNSSPDIEVGYLGASSNDANGTPYWTLEDNSTVVQSNVPVTIGQPALLVVEVTFGASGEQNQVNLYVNPTTLGGAAPATPNATYSTSTASAVDFQSISYYGGNTPNESSLDEIRVGTTFASVTPAPTAAAPAAPTGLTATAGNGQIQLAWNASAGAANYQVWDTTGGNYGEVAAAVTGTGYTVTGLTNGTAYTFYVTASNSIGTSSPSVGASATPAAPVLPSPPTGLTATAGNGQAVLSWTAASGATSYNIYQGTAAGGESATPVATGITGTADTVTGLTNGSTYYFVVAAVNSAGTGANSNEASVTPAGPPAVPAGLSATAGVGQAALNWMASAGAASYNIYQGAAPGGENTTPIATGITATTYTVTGLTNGTPYYFTVAAVSASGTSAPSNEATATPAPPSGLLAYEPFGEAAGAVLSGASGGGDFGWGAPWVVQANSTNVPGYNVVSTNPLTYPGLVANGNYAIGGDKSYGAGRALNLTASGPFSGYLSKGMIGAPGQTIWLSFLMRKDVKDALGIRVTLTPSTGAESWYPGSNSSPDIEVGYLGASSNDANGTPYWTLEDNSTVVQSNVPVTIGQPALLVVEVTFGASGEQNQVNLYVNPTTLGGAAPATPNATYSTSTASAVDFQSISYYGGNTPNESSLDEIRVGTTFASVTPTPSQTSTSLSASNPAPPSGSAVTLTATVGSSGATTPTGTVVFSSGEATLCTVTLDSSGAATCSYTPAASGAVPVTAQYQGDNTHIASSANLTLNVYDPSVTLQLSSTQLVYPGATNVTACVNPAQGATATGAVQILDGTTPLTTQTLQGGGCAYWYISPGLSAGAHVLTAVYTGDQNNSPGTSAASAVTVSPVPVNMSTSCWNASFPYGANYQCTVSASSNAGSAQGAITYSFDSGAAISVPLSNGNAQFAIATPTAGSHQVVVGYAQQTNYAAVTPETESFTVTPAPVNVALTPSTYYTAVGTNISFATAISSWSAGVPNATGSVSFYDGATLLGTVPVNSSGQATFSTTALVAGSHTITATYADGVNYASGSSSATITLTQ